MACRSIWKERESTAGDARPLSNPVKVNSRGWESRRRRRRRKGWEERLGAAYRPPQGQKKEKLSILSLCVVLS